MSDEADIKAGGAEPKVTFGDIVKKLGPASWLALAAVAVPPLGGFLILGFIDTIAQWLTGHKEAGVWIYAAAFAVAAGLALLPTYSQSILGGWAFGISTGFPAALVGFVVGSAIGYAIARPVASDRVARLFAEHPRWVVVREALIGRGFWRTLGIVTLLRLPPNSPFAATNLVLASVRVPWVIYLVGTAVGMSPRTFAAVWLGHSLQGQFTSMKLALEQDKPAWLIIGGIALTVVVVIVVLGVFGHIANQALKRVTNGGERRTPVKG